MEPDQDLPLLEAIAQRRDQVAFEMLLQRHQRAAFGLALSITGSWDRAEEAVQEAWLRVWKAAGTFESRDGASVRSWLLRVVAREGLKVLRKARQERTEKPEDDERMKMGAAAEEHREALETQEALAGMRDALLKLPALDRQLVALAYGAEMSHQEIARVLALPRRAISRRLEEVLGGLRANLKEAGFAAALPWVSPQEFGAAILSGYEPSPDLKARVLSRVAEAGGEALRSVSRRALAAKSGSGVLVPLAMLAAVAAAGVYWVASRETPRSEAASPELLQPVPLANPSVAAAPQKIHRRWNFEKGPVADFKIEQGEWHWVPTEPGHPAGMDTLCPGKELMAGGLPLKLPPGKCWVITMHGTFLPDASNRGQMSATWDPSYRALRTLWMKPFNLQAGAHIRSRAYLMDDWDVLEYLDGQSSLFRTTIGQFEDTLKGEPRVVVFMKNYCIREIEIREIAREEIPERLRDPKKLIADLKLEPANFHIDPSSADERLNTQKTE